MASGAFSRLERGQDKSPSHSARVLQESNARGSYGEKARNGKIRVWEGKPEQREEGSD